LSQRILVPRLVARRVAPVKEIFWHGGKMSIENIYRAVQLT
jgi:hypothetical protein